MKNERAGKIFALIDCNNFFVSCERVFRPDLEGQPVIVLSSNDGCAVARSNEAKALGIPMAAPAFKYRDVIQKHHVKQFSANFELYGNISRRITDVLTTITPNLEIYSIDESFLDLSDLTIGDYEAWGREVRTLIYKWVGVPVSIGIAPSKGLAKLASEHAKRTEIRALSIEAGTSSLTAHSSLLQGAGALSLVNKPPEYISAILADTPVNDIWGVGRRLAPKLKAAAVFTALDFTKMSAHLTQQIMGIQGRQLHAELNGISCWPVQKIDKSPKSIAATRTFGEDTNQINVVESAIASFAATAAFKLRRSGLLASKASVFVTTNRFKPGYSQNFAQIDLPAPTADTGVISALLVRAFLDVYSPSVSYHRAGIVLYDFVPEGAFQTDIFSKEKVGELSKSTLRMNAVDALNQRFGKNTIGHAAEALAKSWQPKHNLRSPRYASRWTELPPVN